MRNSAAGTPVPVHFDGHCAVCPVGLLGVRNMAGALEADTWEGLDQLSLNDVASPIGVSGGANEGVEQEDSPGETGDAPAAESVQFKLSDEQLAAVGEAASAPAAQPAEAQDVDKAILEALCNPRERATALRIDSEVEQFVAGSTRTVMEFPMDMTGYQRLLAHRISQHYGLQTSSVPLERGLSRVVARRCSQTSIPKVKISELKDIHSPSEAAKATPEVTIKRRQGGALYRAPTPPGAEGGGAGPSQGRTVKEREQEYKAARERILGRSSDSGTQSGSVSSQKENGPEKNLQVVDDARSKAVFRNREKEMQDPDYRRGTNRFQRSVFDPNYANYYDRQNAQGLYNVPTYNTEFPVLPGASPAPNNVAAAPFFPQSMGPWGHHNPGMPTMPARTGTSGVPDRGYHPNISGPMAPVLQPFSMPTYTVPTHPAFPMPRMQYGYTPDMMSGPPPPVPMNMYQPPSASQHMPYRPMGMSPYRGMPGYLIPQMPGHEAMGMIPPMSYSVYGGYPNQPVGFSDYSDAHSYHTQHMSNGTNMASAGARGSGAHHGHNSSTSPAELETPAPGSRSHSTAECGSPRIDVETEADTAPKMSNTSKPQAVEN